MYQPEYQVVTSFVPIGNGSSHKNSSPGEKSKRPDSSRLYHCILRNSQVHLLRVIILRDASGNGSLRAPILAFVILRAHETGTPPSALRTRFVFPLLPKGRLLRGHGSSHDSNICVTLTTACDS